MSMNVSLGERKGKEKTRSAGKQKRMTKRRRKKHEFAEGGKRASERSLEEFFFIAT
jgi:hypothetical protein